MVRLFQLDYRRMQRNNQNYGPDVCESTAHARAHTHTHPAAFTRRNETHTPAVETSHQWSSFTHQSHPNCPQHVQHTPPAGTSSVCVCVILISAFMMTVCVCVCAAFSLLICPHSSSPSLPSPQCLDCNTLTHLRETNHDLYHTHTHTALRTSEDTSSVKKKKVYSGFKVLCLASPSPTSASWTLWIKCVSKGCTLSLYCYLNPRFYTDTRTSVRPHPPPSTRSSSSSVSLCL